MTTPHDPFDIDGPDETDAARRLRNVLREEAAMIEPSRNGLARIHSKIALAGDGERSDREHRGWTRPLAAAAAVIVLAGVGVGVAATWDGGSGDNGIVPLSTVSPTESAVDDTPTPTAPATDAPPIDDGYAVTIFYVGKNASPHPWLYREVEHRAKPAGAAVLRDAATAMLQTSPTDSDYRNPWPSGTSVLGISLHDGTATIDLSPEAASGPSGLGAIAAQQLVHTVHAASKDITAVELRIDGTAVTNLWGDALAQPITPGDDADVLAPIWITTPEQGGTVDAGAVTISGEATAWEATVVWEITDADGKQVQRGFVMASAGAPDRGTWTATTKKLAPGTYTATASVTSGNEEGADLPSDTKTFTVH